MLNAWIILLLLTSVANGFDKRIEPRQVGFDWNDHGCKVTI